MCVYASFSSVNHVNYKVWSLDIYPGTTKFESETPIVATHEIIVTAPVCFLLRFILNNNMPWNIHAYVHTNFDCWAESLK